MNNTEKEILLLVSQVKIITESQLKKLYYSRLPRKKLPIRKLLNKMHSEYILSRYRCDVNYKDFKENTYIYCLNGHSPYRGYDLVKNLIKTDIIIDMILSGFEIKRFYRNIRIDDIRCDMYVEYRDPYSHEIKQKIIDISLDDDYRGSKYYNFKNKIRNCTVPFFSVPDVIVISDSNISNYSSSYSKDANIYCVNSRLNNLGKYL